MTKEEKSLRNKKYYQENKIRLNAKSKKYYEDNTEKMAKAHKTWVKNNPAKALERTATRRAVKKQAVFVGADAEFYKFFMEEIYALSSLRTQLTGVEHQVDHIVPLNHAKVCGLHTPNNLQIITATENHKKYNTWVS